jgi:S-DNA-T family DNA segregation ATPase FtsK/SpoIIIE
VRAGRDLAAERRERRHLEGDDGRDDDVVDDPAAEDADGGDRPRRGLRALWDRRRGSPPGEGSPDGGEEPGAGRGEGADRPDRPGRRGRAAASDALGPADDATPPAGLPAGPRRDREPVLFEGVDGREEAPDDEGPLDAGLFAGRPPARPAPEADRGAGDDTDPALARPIGPPSEDYADYALPPARLLRGGRVAPGNRKALDQMTQALESTLEQFGVGARVTRVSRGPTVTRFELSLNPGTKVAAVTKLGDDISYALATAEIRIVAPIPGKSAIGIEVPNRDRDLITLGDVLRSAEAEAARHPLTAGIGVDIAGNPVLVNLATMPHLLIAGATGSGKSVTMNGIVTSILMRATPASVKMILIDPKRVELTTYDGAPHLLTPVVTDAKRATEALDWTVKEMEQRYERLALLGYRNLDAYNAAVRGGTVRTAPALSGRADETWQELPYILLIIDELADLMMVAPRDVESAIVRIAQMARAVGIHLIVATQRPSVDVVTGLIKANIPSRIALAMATQADSRTILDQGGAEKLVGHGDMLFLPANASKPHRIQGCLVEESEVADVVEHCRGQRTPDYRAGVVKEGAAAVAADVLGDDASDEDLTKAAMELVVRSGLGSTSMLQRKLKVGFARAGRIMDELETLGVVGPSEGSKARAVLMTVDELESRGGTGPPGT